MALYSVSRDMQMADAFNQLEDVSWYRFGVYHLTMLISGLSREVRRGDNDLADDPVVETLISSRSVPA